MVQPQGWIHLGTQTLSLGLALYPNLSVLSPFALLSSQGWASLIAQAVKNLPAVKETWVRSLSWEDSLEKGMATHFSIPACKILWIEEPGD